MAAANDFLDEKILTEIQKERIAELHAMMAPINKANPKDEADINGRKVNCVYVALRIDEILRNRVLEDRPPVPAKDANLYVMVRQTKSKKLLRVTANDPRITSLCPKGNQFNNIFIDLSDPAEPVLRRISGANQEKTKFIRTTFDKIYQELLNLPRDCNTGGAQGIIAVARRVDNPKKTINHFINFLVDEHNFIYLLDAGVSRKRYRVLNAHQAKEIFRNSIFYINTAPSHHGFIIKKEPVSTLSYSAATGANTTSTTEANFNRKTAADNHSALLPFNYSSEKFTTANSDALLELQKMSNPKYMDEFDQYQRQATVSPCGRPLYNMAICYFEGRGVMQDNEEFLKYLLAAAKLQLPEAFWALGICYELGIAVPKNDQESFNNLNKASKHGLPKAFIALGICYQQGRGVPINLRQAFKAFLFALEKGHSQALQLIHGLYHQLERAEKKSAEDHFTLGNILTIEAIGLQNLKQAFIHYKLAADQNHPRAQLRTAICYEEAVGTIRDYQQALTYYKLAKTNGIANAQQFEDLLIPKLISENSHSKATTIDCQNHKQDVETATIIHPISNSNTVAAVVITSPTAIAIVPTTAAATESSSSPTVAAPNVVATAAAPPTVQALQFSSGAAANAHTRKRSHTGDSNKRALKKKR